MQSATVSGSQVRSDLLIALTLEVTQKIFICSLDAVCRALRPKKIFLAFEGHKGRKAKKGQNFRKNKYGSKCLELPNSARNQIKFFSPL